MRRLKKRVKDQLTELKAYRRYLQHRAADPIETRFLILARERTGSNLLIDLINSHPQITCFKEGDVLYRRHSILRLQPYLMGLSFSAETPIWGAKIRPRSIGQQNIDPQTFLGSLVALGWKLIYLDRENLFERVVSFQIAQQRKQWHNVAGDQAVSEQFQINIDALMARMEKIETLANEESAMLNQLAHLKLVYERHLQEGSKHQQTLNQLFAYLGVPTVPVATKFKKIMPPNKNQVIANYDEVVEIVSQTRFAKYLQKDSLQM